MQLREYVVSLAGRGGGGGGGGGGRGMVKNPASSYAQLYLESLIH